MTIGILITAAGNSTRFQQAGGEGNKLSTVFCNPQGTRRSLFEHSLCQALASKLAVQVVTQPDNWLVQQVCADYQIAVTLIASTGLGDSIAAGVSATPNWRGWLIHLADMPFITPEVFTLIAQSLTKEDIVRPFYDGQPGHPVGFSTAWCKKLCQLQGDNGARQLLSTAKVKRLTWQDATIMQDIDLPSQLPCNE